MLVLDRIEIIENKITNLENLVKLLQSNNTIEIKQVDNEEFKNEIDELKIIIKDYQRQIDNLKNSELNKIELIVDYNSKIKELEIENSELSSKILNYNNNDELNKLNNELQFVYKEKISLQDKINEQNKEIENLKLQLNYACKDSLKTAPKKTTRKKITICNQNIDKKYNIKQFIDEFKFYLNSSSSLFKKPSSVNNFNQLHIIINNNIIYLYSIDNRMTGNRNNYNKLIYSINLKDYNIIFNDNINFSVDYKEFKKIVDIIYKNDSDKFFNIDFINNYLIWYCNNSQLKINIELNVFDKSIIDNYYNDIFKAEHILTFDFNQLKGNLNNVKFAMSKEETRYILNTVFIDKINNDINYVTCDGRRLIKHNNNSIEYCNNDNIQLLLHEFDIKLFNDTKLDNCNIDILLYNDNHYFLIDNKILYISEVMNGTFPNYNQVIPSFHDIEYSDEGAEISKNYSQFSVKKSILLECLNNAKQFVDKKTNMIIIELQKDNDKLDIIANNNKYTLENYFACDNNYKIALNINFLLDILINSNKEETIVNFKFNNSEENINAPIQVILDNNIDQINIIMPMKIKNDNEQ
jgi:DNA polymerase III sliding clamp (beta) subunit (PCNA family)